ncbi:hypothetical protein DEO72_LG10g2578 [Vigna unguiculata]|uniref:Uncharacterized protein n=1 Tax=Vigna unguiculata TaxID=3917 RepID=A0A4D6NGN7_VIGUN|nr:hypothetical protein DEO72_LG10g2578 [Vigna unguiculata]
MNFASSSGTSSNTNDKFVRIENELATMKSQMQALLAYIASKEDVPESLASIVPDIGSDVPSTNDKVGSSGASKTNCYFDIENVYYIIG